MTEFEQRRDRTMTLNELAAMCHADNHHWWHDLKTGDRGLQLRRSGLIQGIPVRIRS